MQKSQQKSMGSQLMLYDFSLTIEVKKGQQKSFKVFDCRLTSFDIYLI
jgi:hypothetical protein